MIRAALGAMLLALLGAPCLGQSLEEWSRCVEPAPIEKGEDAGSLRIAPWQGGQGALWRTATVSGADGARTLLCAAGRWLALPEADEALLGAAVSADGGELVIKTRRASSGWATYWVGREAVLALAPGARAGVLAVAWLQANQGSVNRLLGRDRPGMLFVTDVGSLAGGSGPFEMRPFEPALILKAAAALKQEGWLGAGEEAVLSDPAIAPAIARAVAEDSHDRNGRLAGAAVTIFPFKDNFHSGIGDHVVARYQVGRTLIQLPFMRAWSLRFKDHEAYMAWLTGHAPVARASQGGPQALSNFTKALDEAERDMARSAQPDSRDLALLDGFHRQAARDGLGAEAGRRMAGLYLERGAKLEIAHPGQGYWERARRTAASIGKEHGFSIEKSAAAAASVIGEALASKGEPAPEKSLLPRKEKDSVQIGDGPFPSIPAAKEAMEKRFHGLQDQHGRSLRLVDFSVRTRADAPSEFYYVIEYKVGDPAPAAGAVPPTVAVTREGGLMKALGGPYASGEEAHAAMQRQLEIEQEAPGVMTVRTATTFAKRTDGGLGYFFELECFFHDELVTASGLKVRNLPGRYAGYWPAVEGKNAAEKAMQERGEDGSVVISGSCTAHGNSCGTMGACETAGRYRYRLQAQIKTK